MKACAEHFGTSVEALRGRRTPREAKARAVAMYLCRSMLGSSYPEIGRIFDRDHSSAMNATKRVGASLLRVDASDILRRLEGRAETARCDHCGQAIDREQMLRELRTDFKKLEQRLETVAKVTA